MPKVSVVMPAYNAEKYIREAVDSILNQTFTDFEFIIINDGSTDRTKEIILEYDDPRIVLLENEKNRGIVATLNKGLDAAKGEYIARMDADDIAVPERLTIQVEYMDKHPEIGVLGTGLKKFGDGIKDGKRIFSQNPDKLKAELLFATNIAHPTVVMRKAVLDAFHICYELEYAGAEDFLMWWKLSQKTQIATLPDILLNYRIHKSQITHDKGEKHKMLMDKMLTERFSDMHYQPSLEGRKALLQYCVGDYNKYSPDTLKHLIDILSDILKWNKKSTFFDGKSLQEVCSLAVLYSMNQSAFNQIDEKKTYKYAVQQGIFSYLMRMKVLYHKLL